MKGRSGRRSISYPGGHGSWCRLNAYWTDCPDCGQEVFYWSCTHGSKVFFDELGGDWPQHECAHKQRVRERSERLFGPWQQETIARQNKPESRVNRPAVPTPRPAKSRSAAPRRPAQPTQRTYAQATTVPPASSMRIETPHEASQRVSFWDRVKSWVRRILGRPEGQSGKGRAAIPKVVPVPASTESSIQGRGTIHLLEHALADADPDGLLRRDGAGTPITNYGRIEFYAFDASRNRMLWYRCVAPTSLLIRSGVTQGDRVLFELQSCTPHSGEATWLCASLSRECDQ